MTSIGAKSSFPASLPEWQDQRGLIMESFTRDVYGAVPEAETSVSWEMLAEHRSDAGQVRRQIGLRISVPDGELRATVLVSLPTGASGVPAFMGLNFQGNHACTADPGVLVAGADHLEATGEIHYDHLARRMPLPPVRGILANRWPFALVADRGHAVITLCYLQTGPDLPEFRERGWYPTLATPESDFGAISVWAWTLSRVLDAVVDGMVPEVDASRVTVMGHSRLGKTALWAAAQDERFAAAISNNSGCMGAAKHREFGETPSALAKNFPHWCTHRFNDLVGSGGLPPVDQHQLIACIAPRPVYVASASEDLHADPEGEFAGLTAALPVWSLYGMSGELGTFPGPGEHRASDGVPVGYHLREGKHSVETFDWEHWLDFTDAWQQRDASR